MFDNRIRIAWVITLCLLLSCFFCFDLHSPQHQGRLSLDLSQQKRTGDFSESSSSRSSRASHGTNSLPSSARLGQSDTHAPTHARKGHRLDVSCPCVWDIMSQHSFLCLLIPLPGSSNNVQYRTERIKIPSTPRYPRSMLGSDRGNDLTGKNTFQLFKHSEERKSLLKFPLTFSSPQACFNFVGFAEFQDQCFIKLEFE